MAKDKEGHGSEGYLGSKEHSGRWNVAEGKEDASKVPARGMAGFLGYSKRQVPDKEGGGESRSKPHEGKWTPESARKRTGGTFGT